MKEMSVVIFIPRFFVLQSQEKMTLPAEKSFGGMEWNWHHHCPGRVFLQKYGRNIRKKNNNNLVITRYMYCHVLLYILHKNN
jgi:hypothetical protein